MICRQVGIFQVGNLVLKATDREPVALTAAAPGRAVVVVRADTIELRRTPEVRVVALVEVTHIVVLVAGRQRRETERIRSVAAIVPTSLRLELDTGIILAANRREQSFPFRGVRQVPTLGANAAYSTGW